MTELLTGFLAGEELSEIYSVLYKPMMTLVIILVSLFVVKLLQKLIRRSFKAGSRLNPGKTATMSTVCSSTAKYVVYFLALCYILTVWGVNPSSLLALGGVASVAVGLGAQSVIQDILAGVFILTEDQFGVGDFVQIESYSGRVESIGMRTTRLRSMDGDLYIIPNGQIKIVTNMSKGFNRAIVDIGINYDENIDEVIKVLEKELKQIYDDKLVGGIIACPEVLGVEKLDDSCVTLRIKADCAVGENWNIERQLRRLIKNAMDRDGIDIPYPQRVVHLHTER